MICIVFLHISKNEDIFHQRGKSDHTKDAATPTQFLPTPAMWPRRVSLVSRRNVEHPRSALESLEAAHVAHEAIKFDNKVEASKKFKKFK